MVGALHAQGDDASRGVKIIDGASGAAAAPAVTAPPPAVSVDIRRISIRAENSAGLDLAILPDIELATGSKVTLRIATKKPGYLILVDVERPASSTQIIRTATACRRARAEAQSDQARIGDQHPARGARRRRSNSGLAAGRVGVIVAILSDRPVTWSICPRRRNWAGVLRPVVRGRAAVVSRGKTSRVRCRNREMVVRRETLFRAVTNATSANRGVRAPD
jgi:hypothetical protein